MEFHVPYPVYVFIRKNYDYAMSLNFKEIRIVINNYLLENQCDRSDT